VSGCCACAVCLNAATVNVHRKVRCYGMCSSVLADLASSRPCDMSTHGTAGQGCWGNSSPAQIRCNIEGSAAQAARRNHSSSSTKSKIGRLMVAVMLRLWPEAEVVVVGVVTAGPSTWWKSTGGRTPARRLRLRLCPSGRSLRLGARGRCRWPRARPPICGRSKVADRQMYKMMS
jgi:hypothetical protein